MEPVELPMNLAEGAMLLINARYLGTLLTCTTYMLQIAECKPCHMHETLNQGAMRMHWHERRHPISQPTSLPG